MFQRRQYFLCCRCASLFIGITPAVHLKSKPDWLIFFLFSANQSDWIIGKDFTETGETAFRSCVRTQMPPHHAICVVSILRQDLTKSCIFEFEDRNTTCYCIMHRHAGLNVFSSWWFLSLLLFFFTVRTASPFFLPRFTRRLFGTPFTCSKKPSRPSTTDPQPLVARVNNEALQAPPQQEATMQEDNQGGTIDPDDPLLIAQTLTYVTDNGSVVMSYSSAPFSTCKIHQCYYYDFIIYCNAARHDTTALLFNVTHSRFCSSCSIQI